MNAFSHNYTLELCNGEKSNCEVVNVSLAGNGPFIYMRAMNGREKNERADGEMKTNQITCSCSLWHKVLH